MIWTDCYKELVEIIRSKDGFLASIPDEYSELRERMAALCRNMDR